MEELLQRVAEIRGMPASLVKRSAQARADKIGTTLEAVLREWAGDADAGEPASAQPEATEPLSDAPAPPAAPAAPAAPPAKVTTDSLVQLAADAKRMPPKLILSSATARAEHSESTIDEVLADWAGVDLDELRAAADAAPASPEAAAEPEPATAAPPEQDSASAPTSAKEEEPEAAPEVDVIEASAPEADTPSEEAKETPGARSGYPRWLAAAFVLIPLLAIIYILLTPSGPDCGNAGQLLVDPTTGQTVNCDGSAFGLVQADFFAEGEILYVQCAACHSADGSGGAGPAFTGGALLAVFPAGSCAEQIEWTQLGTAGWPDPTYGATNKPVGGFGLMPGFGGRLTDEQVAAVSLFNRVEFGGQPLEQAEIDCGLVGGAATEAASS